ncbi:MAG: hypothetical protein COV35_10705 [Alphaproteobacteria bacterium CG11_big_fil_rev_8_21_14_0_20_39_49]|nr:MAG: hypothetical protein COV35_10705 [Alphaproteobacteria bacterium CG11_big_fil_rev_8_21_14_0_20_39_49]
MHVCHCKRPKTKDLRTGNGFTLIELSIVIVLIGLIVAGVIGGQALVHQAKLRSEIGQLAKFETAFNAFYLEYNGIPGDFAKAEAFWGAGNTNSGDGDGRIEKADGTILMAIGNYGGEVSHAFQHLSLSGLINEQFDNSNNINQGFPSSKVESGLGILMGSNYGSGSWQHKCNYKGRNIPMLIMAYRQPHELPDLNAADGGSGTAYKVQYTANIDKKIDGGNGDAIGGKFVAVNPSGTLTGVCHNNGVYQVQNNSSCRACYYLR